MGIFIGNLRDSITDDGPYSFTSTLHNIARDGLGPYYDGHFNRRTAQSSRSGISGPDYGLQEYIVETIYGNEPSGMPTSAPTTSAPTTVAARLRSMGLYDVNKRPTYWPVFPYVMLWVLIGILLLFEGIKPSRRTRKTLNH